MVLPKIQIEWDRLNTEANERLYVLQRAQALYVEIELLDQRIQTTLDRVDSILRETSTSSKSFQQMKVHLSKLKVKFSTSFSNHVLSFVISANRDRSTEECRTRYGHQSETTRWIHHYSSAMVRDELVEVHQSLWIANTRGRYVRSKFVRISFSVFRWLPFQGTLHDHVKHTETVCHYLQTIEKIQADLETRFHAFDDLCSKMAENFDQNRLLEILQVNFILNYVYSHRHWSLLLLSRLNVQSSSNSPLSSMTSCHASRRTVANNVSKNWINFSMTFINGCEISTINLDNAEKTNVSFKSSAFNYCPISRHWRLLSVNSRRRSKPSRNSFTKRKRWRMSFNFVNISNNCKLNTRRCSRRNSTNWTNRSNSTPARIFDRKVHNWVPLWWVWTIAIELSHKTWCGFSNVSTNVWRSKRTVPLKPIESSWRTYAWNWRVYAMITVWPSKANRDYFTWVDQRCSEIRIVLCLYQEISHALGSGRVYVNQAIEHIKLTRSLLNHEYNVDEIDDECQAIDDEWVEFISDFDDQKQELERLDRQFKDLDQDVNRFSQVLKEQETAFQSIIANQSTLESKLERLEQLQVRTSSVLLLSFSGSCVDSDSNSRCSRWPSTRFETTRNQTLRDFPDSTLQPMHRQTTTATRPCSGPI